MRRFILIFTFLLTLIGLTGAQTFQDFLNRVAAAPDSVKSAIVDSFMNAVPSFPYIEQDSLVHFLYRGNATSVSVPGDANGWDPNGFPMSRINGTDLWFYTRLFEPDARLDYKLVLNGSYWILDPLNPNQIMGGYGPNSELRMPAYIPPPEIEYYPDIPHGAIFDTVMVSPELGNSRHVKVYTPPGYAATADSFGVILFHDGLEYISLAHANNVLDYLIWKQRIRPVLAVFVPPVDRTPEYAGNKKMAFSHFIVNQVMAWVDGKYRTRRHPTDRATLGASNGGNIALFLGQNFPQVFGNIAAQSSNVETTISNGFQYGPMLNMRFYLDIGTYDIPVLIPRVQNLVQVLQTRGYPYQYRIYHEGHSWGNWRAHVDNALEMFFPGSALSLADQSSLPRHFRLLQNYPNPFNGETNIRYQVLRPASVVLGIYNVRGQRVLFLPLGQKLPGQYSVRWNARDATGRVLPSGVYFYRLSAGGESAARKLMLLR